MSYVEYLQGERTEWHNRFMAKAAARQARQEAAAQEEKNLSAPVIAGSGAPSSSGSGKGVSSITYTPASFTGSKAGTVRPVNAGISQGWGKSRIKYAAGRHTGIDFGAKTGTRVGAFKEGTVIRAGNEGAYGNAIAIRHKNGTTSFYAHLSGLGVKPGQKVKAGQEIGKVGNTGRSFGSHLHFEVRGRDKYGGDMNINGLF
jgi:murein DD-endopeptidase MepM/ murein hydrolase activator NlpD